MTNARVPFRLSVPAVEAESMPTVFALFKRAPMFLIDVEDEESELVAMYPRLPESIGAILRLALALQEVREIHPRVNGNPIRDVVLFRDVLQCYRDSLQLSNPAVHCARRAFGVEEAAACPQIECPVRCPFVCADCEVTGGGVKALRPRAPQDALRKRGEVAWCPNLQSSAGCGEPS